jgi:transcriptional repressor NrdR
MKCPFCGEENTIVKDSRPTEDGISIRRRRQCPKCDSRFTTFERIQMRELIVIKKNGEKRPFDREKMLRSIETAVRKRSISDEEIEILVNNLVKKLESLGENEIKTSKIGKIIMDELSQLDQVAYVRFASVYKDFNDSKDFLEFIGKIKNEK